MKIRSDFVDNSSSSSFIIALYKKPETPEELRKLLYPDKVYYDPKIEPHCKTCICFDSNNRIVNIIFDLLSNKEKYNFNSHWWDEGNQNKMSEFVKKNEGKHIFEFNFGNDGSDVDGDLGSELEQSYIFDNIPHIVINCH